MTRAVSLSSAAAVRTPSFSRLRVALLLDTLAHARWLVFTPLAKQQGSDLWRPRPSLGGASDFVPLFFGGTKQRPGSAIRHSDSPC